MVAYPREDRARADRCGWAVGADLFGSIPREGEAVNAVALLVADDQGALAVGHHACRSLQVALDQRRLHVVGADRARRGQRRRPSRDELDAVIEEVDDGERAVGQDGEARGATQLARAPALEPTYRVCLRLQKLPLLDLGS